MSYTLRSKQESEREKVVEKWGSLDWLAGKRIGNANELTIGRCIIKKGHSNPRHYHTNSEEVLYLIRGRLKHFIEDKEIVVEPGDTLVISSGDIHNALSIGEEDADMITAYPGVRDFYLEDERGSYKKR